MNSDKDHTMTVKAVLFDKDGTLIDFMGTFGPATTRVIQALANGSDVVAAELAETVDFNMVTQVVDTNSVLIAGSLEDIVRVFAPVLNQAYSADLLTRVDELFVKHSTESLQPFPFTERVLDELRAMKVSLGVATNDSETGALSHLNRLEISDRFTFIAGYDSGHGAKPEPGMVSAFINELGLQPSEVMMVGDSTHDLIAGQKAGAMTIAVTSGEAEAIDLAPHADHVLDDISQLPALIKSLNESAS